METLLAEAPWMAWMTAHEGYKESDATQNKFMSQGWPLVHLPGFHTISGREHAWCAMTVMFALHETGYKGSGSAAAASYSDKKGYGTKSDIKFGAIICVEHVSGAHHVTFFDHWVDEDKKIAVCFGGNQSDSLRKSTYNFSGNAHGHDEIVGVRWPVKA